MAAFNSTRPDSSNDCLHEVVSNLSAGFEKPAAQTPPHRRLGCSQPKAATTEKVLTAQVLRNLLHVQTSFLPYMNYSEAYFSHLAKTA
ncbi:hypothetical protein [Runella sp.]|uniref:hypothetical protein n=1 Tax=Runella sp. TaxID=1960881 RepID=UPI003D0DED19